MLIYRYLYYRAYEAGKRLPTYNDAPEAFANTMVSACLMINFYTLCNIIKHIFKFDKLLLFCNKSVLSSLIIFGCIYLYLNSNPPKISDNHHQMNSAIWNRIPSGIIVFLFVMGAFALDILVSKILRLLPPI